MRKLLVIVAVLAALGGGMTSTTEASPKVRCPGVHQGINFYRNATHTWQNKLGVQLTKSSKQPIRSCAYARWVARLWMKRAHTWRVKYAEYQAWMRRMSDPVEAIKHVFGSRWREAVAVASCETGGTLSVWAQNGQYLGLFQMGSSERATYGHGSTPLAQAQAAHRYFTASGSDWSPWQCRPYGLAW